MLARTLGCTVRELLARIDSRELTEWLAYYGLNPWGPERSDLRAGMVASTVANCLTSGSFKPSDFMPKYGPQPEPVEQTPEQLRDMAMKITAMLGGAIS